MLYTLYGKQCVAFKGGAHSPVRGVHHTASLLKQGKHPYRAWKTARRRSIRMIGDWLSPKSRRRSISIVSSEAFAENRSHFPHPAQMHRCIRSIHRQFSQTTVVACVWINWLECGHTRRHSPCFRRICPPSYFRL